MSTHLICNGEVVILTVSGAEVDDVLLSSKELSVEGSQQSQEEEKGRSRTRGKKRKRLVNPSELFKGARFAQSCILKLAVGYCRRHCQHRNMCIQVCVPQQL